jgi:energy-coupling factor transporter transmembrane protein EcfT
MIEKATEGDQFNWRLPLAALLATLVIFLILAILQSESLVYLFFMVPIISLFLIVCAVYSAIAGKKRRCLAILSMLAIFWVLSVPLFKNYLAIRSAERWLIWSNDFKAKVAAQPASPNGDFKHLYWDGWGWGGENTTVYLVFDPTDSLSVAAKSHQPAKFDGLPCKVDRVFRLEPNWYAAQFFTGSDWDHCN